MSFGTVQEVPFKLFTYLMNGKEDNLGCCPAETPKLTKSIVGLLPILPKV